jgi:hypothetical protein
LQRRCLRTLGGGSTGTSGLTARGSSDDGELAGEGLRGWSCHFDMDSGDDGLGVVRRLEYFFLLTEHSTRWEDARSFMLSAGIVESRGYLKVQ